MKLLPVFILIICLAIPVSGCDQLKGPTGPDGEKGKTGETGSQGEKGATGYRGEQGTQGEKGNTGATGSQGEKGNTGATGATGSQGPQGEPGKNFEFTIIDGKLAPGEPEYWVIETGFDLNLCIISVYIGNVYRPTWWKLWDEIWIINDEISDSGDEYRIIIASEPG